MNEKVRVTVHTNNPDPVVEPVNTQVEVWIRSCRDRVRPNIHDEVWLSQTSTQLSPTFSCFCLTVRQGVRFKHHTLVHYVCARWLQGVQIVEYTRYRWSCGLRRCARMCSLLGLRSILCHRRTSARGKATNGEVNGLSSDSVPLLVIDSNAPTGTHPSL